MSIFAQNIIHFNRSKVLIMEKEKIMVMRPRFELLDGLRGVAALVVLMYHLFEAIAFSQNLEIERVALAEGVEPQMIDQNFFHGFLAVDFFFILSGFVMGYAYDERWNKMSAGQFFCRRLIRLHPMVVAGTIIGLAAFCIQGCVMWDGTSVPLSVIVTSTLLTLFLLPSPNSLDIRGNTESFPINGTFWSLFFEYIGSILYALLLRRLSTKALKLWVTVAFVALLLMSVLGPDGCVAMGWSSNPLNMLGGLLRMSFAYPLGLLLARLYREKYSRTCCQTNSSTTTQISSHTTSHISSSTSSSILLFCVTSALLIILFLIPNLGAANPYYEVCCIGFAFSSVVWFTAVLSRSMRSNGFINYLGRLSYPLYAVHYPLIYLYIDWINRGVEPFGSSAWVTPAVLSLTALALATLLLIFYDEPLRKKLAAKFKD